jgi:hypothetical protein
MLSTLKPCPPAVDAITSYDEAHFTVYLRLLDAEAAGVAWQTAAHVILSLDVEAEPETARQVWSAHLFRAEWMTRQGYRYLLKAGA